MAITQEQEQQVQRACYSIGSSQIAPWLRKITELENRVTALERMYGEKLMTQPRETARV